MEIETVYTSCCVNRSPHCLEWHPEGDEVLFGGGNAVVVARFEDGVLRIQRTLVDHTSRVNLVRWIHHDLFVSASTDSTARVWKRVQGSLFTPLACLRHPSGSVTCADGYFDKEQKVVHVATSSTDATIRIWKVGDEPQPEEGDSTQVLPIPKNGFALDLRIDRTPSGIFFLFASTDKCNVIIYLSNNGTDFIQSHTLVGHEDWVQSISIVLDGKSLLVASGGQDTFIRLWRISPVTKEKALEETKLVKDLGPEEEIRHLEDVFSLHDEFYFTVVIESVLAGHEDKVYGLEWKKLPKTGELTLLSCSMDKSMIRWTYDNESGIWIEQVRVGEIGGNTLGFLGCTSHSDGSTLIGYNFSGAIHLWREVSERSWTPGVSPSGHHGPVLDLDWDRKGRYFFTVGSDQTTRVHGPWKRSKGTSLWAEMGRPQVHGHDLSCITALPSHRFASGAEEKITRVFEATRNFLENFGRLAQMDLTNDIEAKNAQGASVPSLGLSNKAVKNADSGPINEEARHVKDMYPDVYFKSETYIQPPSEDSLCQNTLWPELQKLYGHGYEIFSLASNNEGSIIASVCKAAKAEHAQVILWDANTWKLLDRLSGHTLTVTQMEFSPCDNFLLTVSRDRTWCLFSRVENQFILIANTDKSTSVHQRLLWSCSWSKDSKYFCTASRDKKIAIWTRRNESSGTCLGEYGLACDKPLVLGDSVTAVAFSPLNLLNGSYLLAAGLESGDLVLLSWSKNDGWNVLQTLEKNEAHHKTIKRLRFCPDKSNLLLASCGEDNLVKLFSLNKAFFCE